MISIVFPFKAMPFNNYQKSAKNGRRFTTQKGKQYCYEIDSVLKNNSSQIVELLEDFDSSKRMFKACIYVFQTQFYKKDGTFHKRAGDCDGYQKIIFDRFFKYIGYDDFLVKKFFVEKGPGTKDFFVLKIGHMSVRDTAPSDLSYHL